MFSTFVQPVSSMYLHPPSFDHLASHVWLSLLAQPRLYDIQDEVPTRSFVHVCENYSSVQSAFPRQSRKWFAGCGRCMADGKSDLSLLMLPRKYYPKEYHGS
ncbi:hypothetical protein MRB53_040802 [Persea americana]|nr:hypothetical protein MRB53_040802 [Persea americana]